MWVKRILPLGVLALGLVLYFVLDLGRFLSFESLREHRSLLIAWVDTHALLAPMVYVLLYVLVVAFSLPGGAVMTIAGGFLFGAVAGGIYAVIGATIGATALFLVAKTSLGDYLLSKARGQIQRMQKGFADNALSYLFILRLVPIFPFFLVNLAPAFLGVPLRTYLIATFFGIMPGTFVYALTGSGIGSVLESGEELSLSGIMTPQMIAALVGLALLALLPVIYRHMKGGNNGIKTGGAH